MAVTRAVSMVDQRVALTAEMRAALMVEMKVV
jgi:hypothetical protein